MRAGIDGDAGGSSRILIGQSYRLQNSDLFVPSSGLGTKLSDFVGRIDVSPSYYFDVFYRFRFEKDNFRAQRQEVGFSGGPEKLRLSATYVRLPPDLIGGDPSPRQQISVGVGAGVSRNWTVSVATTQNLTNTLGVSTISSSLVAAYRDECMSFIASLSQSGTSDRDVKSGASLLFTLVFKNIGEISAPSIATSGL